MTRMTISATELAARWSYAELDSSRFADTYKLPPGDPLRVKSKAGEAFEVLSADEKEKLRGLLQTHTDRGPFFYKLLMSFPTFKREEWTTSQLRNAYLTPGLGWARLADFADGKSDPAVGKELRDALAVTPVDHFIPKGTVIIVPCRFNNRDFWLLLDGSFTTLQFLRGRMASAKKLPVWVPEGASIATLTVGPS
jgi:hypothetical protein